MVSPTGKQPTQDQSHAQSKGPEPSDGQGQIAGRSVRFAASKSEKEARLKAAGRGWCLGIS